MSPSLYQLSYAGLVFTRRSERGDFLWLRGRDSNPEPQGYEPCELPIALPRVMYNLVF